MAHDVCHAVIWEVTESGKSEPLSTIQETVWERGGGEKRRAPSAEYDPAPPRMSKTGGLGGR
jgi:hypothetical protein